MQRKSFGTSNLQVTPIGLGLAALGRPGYINVGHAADLNGDYAVEAMAAHAGAVLDAAYAAGIRYFDAARSYGRAEAFLAGWLQARAIAPESVVVGSKWGYTYTADWQVAAEKREVKEHSLARLQTQWAESQALLGPQLNLYQIHSATLASGVLENRPVLNQLARLKEDGVAIGLSVSGSAQAAVIDQAVDIQRDGRRLFDSVQATWNLLERSAGPALARAHDAGLGVIVKEALANGRLTEWGDNSSPAGMARLHSEAGRLGTTVDALALAAVLAQPWADIVLSGAAQTGHVTSNLGALAVAFDAAAEEALIPLAEPAGTYWQKRSNLAWN